MVSSCTTSSDRRHQSEPRLNLLPSAWNKLKRISGRCLLPGSAFTWVPEAELLEDVFLLVRLRPTHVDWITDRLPQLIDSFSFTFVSGDDDGFMLSNESQCMCCHVGLDESSIEHCPTRSFVSTTLTSADSRDNITATPVLCCVSEKLCGARKRCSNRGCEDGNMYW